MKTVIAFFFALASLGSAFAADDQVAARTLAIKSQNTLNDNERRVIDLRQMADRAEFERVKKELNARLAQWPAETDATEKWRPCKSALEKASYVADLTRMKATSSLEDKVWELERGKMAAQRTLCAHAVRS